MVACPSCCMGRLVGWWGCNFREARPRLLLLVYYLQQVFKPRLRRGRGKVDFCAKIIHSFIIVFKNM